MQKLSWRAVLGCVLTAYMWVKQQCGNVATSISQWITSRLCEHLAIVNVLIVCLYDIVNVLRAVGMCTDSYAIVSLK